MWLSRLPEIPSRISCEGFLVLACCVPLVAAWAEFTATGFLRARTGFSLLMWPGLDWQWAVRLPVWLSMGVMSASYLVALAWLVRKRILGRSFLLGISFLILGITVGGAVNLATGWRDEQTLGTMDLAGLIDRAIFAHWHNPLWEEVVFRGLPLMLLFALTGFKGGRRLMTSDEARRWAAAQPWTVLVLYFIVPALATGLYHVPGHGPSRFVDSFIISLGFSWLALRCGFAAPLALHYLLDGIIILSLHKVSAVRPTELVWLRANAHVINSAWSLLFLGWLFSLAVAIASMIRSELVRKRVLTSCGGSRV